MGSCSSPLSVPGPGLPGTFLHIIFCNGHRLIGTNR